MIANNRNHNHMRVLQLTFCKLIVIFFFFLGFFVFSLTDLKHKFPRLCGVVLCTIERRKGEETPFFLREDLECSGLSTSFALQMIDVTVVSCSDISLMEENGFSLKEHCPK